MQEVQDEVAAVAEGQERIEQMLASAMSERGRLRSTRHLLAAPGWRQSWPTLTAKP